jgi:NitT/TauT family transport system substrate-binding protein
VLKKDIIIFSIILLLFSSCNTKKNDKIVLSVNEWIGYSPIFYAYKKHWLDHSTFEIVTVASLGESVSLFEGGFVDGFSGTQYEYRFLKHKQIEPIMLIDKSYGGDAVLSNIDIDEIRNSKNKIDVYFEANTINKDVFLQFMSANNFDISKFIFHHMDQDSISNLNNFVNDFIIVTYEPYLSVLEKRGLKILTSTKDGYIDVIDALFVSSKVYKLKFEDLKILKWQIDRAINVANNNPKEFYETVKPYIGFISYQEFLDSLKLIKWINKDNPQYYRDIFKNSLGNIL